MNLKHVAFRLDAQLMGFQDIYLVMSITGEKKQVWLMVNVC